MPTLQDVAHAAGVSQATASRALQGGACAATTRAKVRAAAEALGWVPDPGLASLVSRRWRRRSGMSMLGFIHQTDPKLLTGWESDRAALVAVGRQVGWTLIDMPCDQSDGAELLAQARSFGVQGLACGLLHGDGARLEPLWDALPGVAVGKGSFVPPIPQVGSDIFAGYQNAWMALRAAGWRRIGVTMPDWGDAPSVRLRRGALLDRWYELDPEDRIPFHVHPPSDPRPVLEWAARYRPELVLSMDPLRATALRQAGLTLPLACVSTYGPSPDPVWAGSCKDSHSIVREALALLSLQVRSGLVGRQLNGLSHVIQMPYHDGGLLPRPEAVRR